MNYVIGPLAALFDANNWQFYTSGILYNCGTHVDHAVQIVGINLRNKYYIVRII